MKGRDTSDYGPDSTMYTISIFLVELQGAAPVSHFGKVLASMALVLRLFYIKLKSFGQGYRLGLKWELRRDGMHFTWSTWHGSDTRFAHDEVGF
jgi:hypothetical protein